MYLIIRFLYCTVHDELVEGCLKKMKISAISAKKDVRTKMLFCFSFPSCYDYTGWKHQFLDDRLTKDLRWGPFLCWRGRCRLAHSVHWVVRVVCCSFLSSTDVRFQPSTEVLGSSICICPLFKRSVPAIPTVRSSHLLYRWSEPAIQTVCTRHTNVLFKPFTEGLYQLYKRSVPAIKRSIDTSHINGPFQPSTDGLYQLYKRSVPAIQTVRAIHTNGPYLPSLDGL